MVLKWNSLWRMPRLVMERVLYIVSERLDTPIHERNRTHQGPQIIAHNINLSLYLKTDIQYDTWKIAKTI